MLADVFQDSAAMQRPEEGAGRLPADLVDSAIVNARLCAAMSWSMKQQKSTHKESRHAYANSVTDRVVPIPPARCPRAYSNLGAASSKQPPGRNSCPKSLRSDVNVC